VRAVQVALAAVVLTWAAIAAAPVRVTTARPFQGGPFEASGAVHFRNAGGVLFVDNARADEVLWMPIRPDGTQAAGISHLRPGVSVRDPEGITTDGSHVYVVSSLSRSQRDDSADLTRFRFDAASQRIDRVDALSGLRTLLRERVPELGRAQELNVEGLAWDPAAGRLLLGMRVPLADGQALVIPVKLRTRGAPFRADQLDVGAALRLPLEGAGIRSIEYDDEMGAFQVIAGPTPDHGTDFRLIAWRPGGDVRNEAAVAAELKPEGVAPATVGGRRVMLIVCDSSRYFTIP
jgi:hypothetical protein